MVQNVMVNNKKYCRLVSALKNYPLSLGKKQ